MTYLLEQYEISLLQAINCQLDTLYNENVAMQIRQILLQSISTGRIEEDQLKQLQKLLLEFDTHAEEDSPVDGDDDFYEEWPEWKKISDAGIKRKILYLHHHLSNWLLIHYVVYQKQLTHKPSEGINKILDPILGIDRER